MTGAELSFHAPPGGTRLARVLAVIGVAAVAAGVLVNPDRLWTDWFLVSYYLVGIALAGLFFVALQYVSGATWSIAFRRVPEAMAATLPVAVAFVVIGLLARPSLYPWTSMTVGPEEGAFRQVWLTWPFFIARALVYAAVWVGCCGAILRISRRQDDDRRRPDRAEERLIPGEASAPGRARGAAQAPAKDADRLAGTRANVRLSAAFLVLFAITFSLASFDWVMSREPLWYSTIFAAYNFAGLFLSGLAVLVVLAVWLEAAGPLRHVLREEHLHDLGKLLFAFSTFWMYLWFSQYMLIWYANIPEEAAYFVARTRQAWAPLFFLNVALNWAVPFVVLLRRDTKRQRATLVKVAVVLLIGRWLDLYLMLLPPVFGPVPGAGVVEFGVTAGGVGLFLFALFHAFGRASLVPTGDPFLLESLHYHQ